MEYLSDSVCKVVFSVGIFILLEELLLFGGFKICKSNELFDLNRVNIFFLIFFKLILL